MKFNVKIGLKKLSVSYYQEKRLKKIEGISKKIYPIYFVIIYKQKTLRVRSILWKRLLETNNEFQFGIPFRYNNADAIIEGSADIEKTFVNDKGAFEELCEYEFQCLRQIIVFACQNDPEDVNEIVNAYDFYGQDGLREVSSNIIKQFIGNKSTESYSIRGVTIKSYNQLSSNAVGIVQSLLESQLDPVSIVCFIEETGLIDRLKTQKKLPFYEGFKNLIDLIANLGRRSVHSIESLSQSRDFKSLGIYYFPKILFFYVENGDLSKREKPLPQEEDIKVIDLLKLQKFLTKL